MKTSYLITITLLCLMGYAYFTSETAHATGPDASDWNLQQPPSKVNAASYAETASNRPKPGPSSAPQVRLAPQQGGRKMHPVKDPKTGMISAHLPLPGEWTIGPRGWSNTNGAEVTNQSYPQVMQMGLQSIDQVIQTVIYPGLRQMGVRVDQVVDLPTVARSDQREIDGYWKVMPTRNYCSAKGLEVTDPRSGNRGLIVLHFVVSQTAYGSNVFSFAHQLTTKPANFEGDGEDVIFALANKQMNPDYVAVHNQSEMRKAGVRDASFQAKMADRQRNFDNWQKTQKDLSSVNDIYFDTYKNTSGMKDAGHAKSIDAIHERETMINPYTGHSVHVESGYKYYYINRFGEYFGTNDEFYNPARDPNVNHQEWRKTKSGGSNY